MRACELYYTPGELSLMWRLHVKTVLSLIRSGKLGDQVVNLGSDSRPRYRVSASAANDYIDRQRVFSDMPQMGLKACSRHELRRKAALAE